jgi:hypothetical protein
MFVLAVAIIVAGSSYLALRFIGGRELAALNEMSAQVKVERATLDKLQSKTWGLELVNYNDGTRGIILPRGAKADRVGVVPDGRIAIVIN